MGLCRFRVAHEKKKSQKSTKIFTPIESRMRDGCEGARDEHLKVVFWHDPISKLARNTYRDWGSLDGVKIWSKFSRIKTNKFENIIYNIFTLYQNIINK